MPDSTIHENLDALRARVGLATKFGWMVVSGISALVYREKGEQALNDLWRALMLSEQTARFREALGKLGITSTAPAVIAAQYHYFSNSIGGIRMHYIEESPRKVWIRYLPPWGTFPGIAALAVPTSVRRTILSTWHPRNGELLGCLRLGWVVTKVVAEGHPYDEGYFYEYDHDLQPGERVRFETVEHSPEFDPAQAPKLDPALWPEARVLKGSANYASDYALHVVECVQRMFGTIKACQMIEAAMRLLAVQYIAEFAQATATRTFDVRSIAKMFQTLLSALRNECTLVAESADAAELRFSAFAPFTAVASEDIRRALFGFVSVGVQVLNGRIAVERRYDKASGIECWRFVDHKRWLG